MRASLLGLDEPRFVTESGHRVWNEMAIELEMAELLYSLVRYSKPEVVVECGTGSGRSSTAILAALSHNDKGFLTTFEPQEEFFLHAKEMFKERDRIEVIHGRSEEYEGGPDFVFVDTGGGPDYREPEIAYWLEHSARPLVVVHDGARKYKSFDLGEGLIVFGHDGVWIGRGKE